MCKVCDVMYVMYVGVRDVESDECSVTCGSGMSDG